MSKSKFKRIQKKILSEQLDDRKVKTLLSDSNEKVLKQVSKKEETLLHLTIKYNYEESSLYLIREMSKQLICNKDKNGGNTPLHLAVEKKQEKVIKAITKKTRDSVFRKNDSDETPLHFAIMLDKSEIVELLLHKNKSFTEKKYKDGKTFLHIAAEFGAIETIELLLEKCHLVDLVRFINVKDSKGQTASTIATKSANRDVAQLITKYERKCLLNLDDSSDEEDSVANYQVVKKLKDFAESMKDNDNQDHCFFEIAKSKSCLSFITHAAGVNLFYAPKVQKSYYQLKSQKLTTSKLKVTLDPQKLLSPRMTLACDDLRSNSNLEFLAKLRLHNRSEKREYKNCQNDNSKMKANEYKDDGLVKDTKLKLDNKFIGYAKIECQTNYTRSELILYGYDNKPLKYKQIFDNQKTYIFQSIFDFNKPVDNEFSYHLFGCETIKNPAAFIHHKMVLDLIIAKKMDWEDALIKKQMPMTMDNAVMASRILNSYYSEHMPHEYLYDVSYHELEYSNNTKYEHSQNVKKLLKKEIDITAKWLELKLGKAEANNIIKYCDVNLKSHVSTKNEDAITRVWNIILDSCEDWYPGVLGEVAIII